MCYTSAGSLKQECLECAKLHIQEKAVAAAAAMRKLHVSKRDLREVPTRSQRRERVRHYLLIVCSTGIPDVLHAHSENGFYEGSLSVYGIRASRVTKGFYTNKNVKLNYLLLLLGTSASSTSSISQAGGGAFAPTRLRAFSASFFQSVRITKNIIKDVWIIFPKNMPATRP